jgi:ribosomal-protein-alanine N-acetyltransferase
VSGSHALRPADGADLNAVWAAVKAARLFDSRDALEVFWREAPWRVQVSDAGDAAVVERWRRHLGLLAVRGLWCAERDMPDILGDLLSLAHTQGFEDLLSPLVPEELVGPYEAAGMHVAHRGVTMRAGRPRHREAVLAPGVAMRLAGEPDLDDILVADEASFMPFWRYDAPSLAMLLTTHRTVIATSAGEVIGYTLCTVDRDEGMLGRLAVVPRERGRGIGAALLDDALGYLSRAGVRGVTLHTQEENHVSRALYESRGFRQAQGAACFLTFGSGTDYSPTGA